MEIDTRPLEERMKDLQEQGNLSKKISEAILTMSNVKQDHKLNMVYNGQTKTITVSELRQIITNKQGAYIYAANINEKRSIGKLILELLEPIDELKNNQKPLGIVG